LGIRHYREKGADIYMSETDNPWLTLYKSVPNINLDQPLSSPDAEDFLEKAQNAIESANNEIQYGETIANLFSIDEEISESQKALATIGIWHYECAIELFNKALRNLGRAQAAGLSKEKENEVEAQIKEYRKQLSLMTMQKNLAQETIKH
jgi:hypothetical protein